MHAVGVPPEAALVLSSLLSAPSSSGLVTTPEGYAARAAKRAKPSSPKEALTAYQFRISRPLESGSSSGLERRTEKLRRRTPANTRVSALRLREGSRDWNSEPPVLETRAIRPFLA